MIENVCSSRLGRNIMTAVSIKKIGGDLSMARVDNRLSRLHDGDSQVYDILANHTCL